jgi:hypothetical protein
VRRQEASDSILALRRSLLHSDRSHAFINAGHFLNEKGARGPQRGAAKPVAWFHATVIACATHFDSTSAMTATCFTCRKGAAKLDIDRANPKHGHAHGVR